MKDFIINVDDKNNPLKEKEEQIGWKEEEKKIISILEKAILQDCKKLKENGKRVHKCTQVYEIMKILGELTNM